MTAAPMALTCAPGAALSRFSAIQQLGTDERGRVRRIALNRNQSIAS